MDCTSSGYGVSLDAIVSAASDHVSCDLADEVVILQIHDGVYYSLNPVATRVWQLIQEPRTVSDLRDALLDEYAVERDMCTADLIVLLEDLRQWNLINVRNGTRE